MNWSKIITYAASGLFLFICLKITYSDIAIKELIDGFNNISLFWLLMVLVATVVVHVIRAQRWQLLLNTNSVKTGFYSALEAMMIGYFVNLAIPRGGELSRCAAVKESGGASFAQSLGTVIIERTVDLICLAIFTGLTLALNYDRLSDFFIDNLFSPVYQSLNQINIKKLIFIVAILLVLLTVVLAFFINYKRKSGSSVILRFITEIKKGMLSIMALGNKFQFLISTVAIWIIYFLMTYWWFLAYAPGNAISVKEAMVIVTIGNIGRTIPIQGGGAGAYHFLMMQIIMAYGMSRYDGQFLGFAIHGVQTIFYIVTGIVFSIGFLYRRIKRNSTQPTQFQRDDAETI